MTAPYQPAPHRDSPGVALRVPPLAASAGRRRHGRRRSARRDRRRSVHAGVFGPSGRCHDRGRFRPGRTPRRAGGIRRDRDARTGVDDPAPDRLAGDRAVHAADHVRRVARCFRARAAVLHRLARQQLCRLDRAQDHPRHVGARPAQRHHPDGVAAVARGVAGVDDPARAALAVARPRDRRRRDDLRSDDRRVHDALHRAGGARFQCLGHQGRRHAGGCLDLQRRGEVVRRRSARGRAAGSRHQPVADARAAILAALQLQQHGAARGAAVPARLGDRRRAAVVDGRPRLAGRRHLCA